jgi:hypothetical protein
MHRSPRRSPGLLRVACAQLCLVVTLTFAHVSASQTLYKWTDDQGVIHFSDIPPSGGQKYEERGTPLGEPGAAANAAPANAAGDAPAAPAAAGAAPEAGTTAAARVILVSHNTIPRSTDARHLIGVVKNVGGHPASRVAVTAHIADSTGRECAREEIEVVPNTLPPGESGNFDATLRNSCFADGGTVDPEPHCN